MPGVDDFSFPDAVEDSEGTRSEFTKLTIMMGGYHWWDQEIPSITKLKELALSALKRQLPDIFKSDDLEPVHIDARIQYDCIPQPLPHHQDRMMELSKFIKENDLLNGRFSMAGAMSPGVGMAEAVKSAWDIVEGIERDPLLKLYANGLEAYEYQ
jgi:hypothetical protein